MPTLFVKSSALISDDGRYRYWLDRTWDEMLRRICWVCLNPSTADYQLDDPTLRRIVSFSTLWGFGGATVVNLFALRATDPRALYKAEDPVGQHCDLHLEAYALVADQPVVAAWGVHGNLHGRDQAVLALLARHEVVPHCLGVTKGGHPVHPLYIPSVRALIPFTGVKPYEQRRAMHPL